MLTFFLDKQLVLRTEPLVLPTLFRHHPTIYNFEARQFNIEQLDHIAINPILLTTRTNRLVDFLSALGCVTSVTDGCLTEDLSFSSLSLLAVVFNELLFSEG